MKKLSIYLTMSIMAVLAVACSKNGSQVDPVAPEAAKEANIGFGSASAKAPGALEVNTEKPMQIRVFDFYTKQGADEIKYIDDQIQEATTAGAWAFVSENEYAWKKGTHKFFGWVAVDEVGTEVPGLTYNNKVLTLAETELPGTDNTDYRYATIQTVEWPDATLTDGIVPMTVKHLSSALTYKVTDYNYNGAVTLNSITIKGVQNKASATVNYSGEEAVVTITNPTTGDIALGCTAEDYTVDTSGEAPIFIGGTTCVWPQDVSGATIEIKYTPTAEGSQQKTVTLDLPDMTWTAGYRTTLNLQIVNKGIELTFVVQDWEVFEVGAINTSTGSINMSNVTWMNTKVRETADGEDKNTLVNTEYCVYMYYQPYVKNGDAWTQYTANNGYFPAQGYFTVNYPKSGLFKMDFIQATHWNDPVPEGIYEIWIYDNTLTTENKWRKIKAEGETITNDTVYFQVRATDAVPASHPEYRAQIDIWFKPAQYDAETDKWVIPEDAEWISAYSEIRANYALVIQAATN